MKKRKVSLIIPVRNEEGCIGKVLQEIPRKFVDEVILVDGHSTDNTVKEIKKNMKKNDRLVAQKGMGYGAAFLQGFKIAKGNVIVMMDGDGSHNPADIPFLIRRIDEGYEYVMSSRYAIGGRSHDDTFVRWLGNFIFTKLTNIVHGTRITDSLYLFTAITKEGLDKLNIKSKGFEICPEILIKAHRAGLRFAEEAAIERARYSGDSKVNAFFHGWKIMKMILQKYE